MSTPFARQIHPGTGAWEMTAAGAFKRSPSPGMSAVLLVLRTQLGDALGDRELGVDYRAARRKGGPLEENLRAAVLAGLARLVTHGVIRAPAVVVTADDLPQGARHVAEVSFFDPVLGRRESTSETLP